jgi:hypothetical protein
MSSAIGAVKLLVRLPMCFAGNAAVSMHQENRDEEQKRHTRREQKEIRRGEPAHLPLPGHKTLVDYLVSC